MKGIIETDWPSLGTRWMFQRYGHFSGNLIIKVQEKWHNAPYLQKLHGLRGFKGNRMESKGEACRNIQSQIRSVLGLALDNYRNKNINKAHYWLGHAMHTLQDTFSTAHSRHKGNMDIKDICTWGKRVSNVCYHSPSIGTDGFILDHKDAWIWKRSSQCQANPFARGASCLSTRAHMAYRAIQALANGFGLVLNEERLIRRAGRLPHA